MILVRIISLVIFIGAGMGSRAGLPADEDAANHLNNHSDDLTGNWWGKIWGMGFESDTQDSFVTEGIIGRDDAKQLDHALSWLTNHGPTYTKLFHLLDGTGNIFWTESSTLKYPILGIRQVLPSYVFPVTIESGNQLSINFDYNFEYTPEGFTESSYNNVTVNGTLYNIEKYKVRTFGKDLHSGDKIKTDEHTRLKVEIPEVGEVIANPETEFEITTDPVNEYDILIDQLIGELQIDWDVPTRENPFKVTMPQAVAGVRGTKFVTSVYENGTNSIVRENK